MHLEKPKENTHTLRDWKELFKMKKKDKAREEGGGRSGRRSRRRRTGEMGTEG